MVSMIKEAACMLILHNVRAGSNRPAAQLMSIQI